MPCDYKNERNKRADSINSRGITMSLAPCTCCYHKTLPCKLLNGSKKCGECRRANVTCDIDPPTDAQWDRMKTAENAIKEELQKAREDQREAFARQREALARQTRLERQQEVLKDRIAEMWRRDLNSLEELEEIERFEAAVRERVNTNAHAAPVPDPFDFPANEDYLDPGKLASLAAFAVGPADPGSGGETPQVSQNS